MAEKKIKNNHDSANQT